MITSILAISRNVAIGKGGKLPWHYAEDLKFFKQTTMGHAIAMGSNTWRSIGRALPGRLSVVISRNADLELPPGVIRLSSKAELVEFSKYLAGDLYLIGGAQIYVDFADVIDKWLVTYVPVTIEDADTFMPENFLDGFSVEDEQDLGSGLVVKTLRRGEISGVSLR